MEPGRELDALIAEKVMGWRKTRGGYTNDLTKQWSVPEKQLPLYSTSIKAAWEVVEKLRGKGYYFDLDGDKDGGARGELIPWIAEFSNVNKKKYSGYAKTAPHAICLAALEAIKT